jgi:hypothetical protein
VTWLSYVHKNRVIVPNGVRGPEALKDTMTLSCSFSINSEPLFIVIYTYNLSNLSRVPEINSPSRYG